MGTLESEGAAKGVTLNVIGGMGVGPDGWPLLTPTRKVMGEERTSM